MIDDALHAKVVQQLQDEIKRLQKLVFQAGPMKRSSISRLFNTTPAQGFGGVTDYEMWLRTIEGQELDHLIRLHTGAIDAMRYRRRFIQHERERRCLHSSYGKHPLEHLATRDLP